MREQRLRAAARQWGVMSIALLVLARIAERLRPAEVVPRPIVAAPFLWTVVVWGVVLAFHAIAFERSEKRDLERRPLSVGVACGLVVAFVGLVGVDANSAVERVGYALVNGLGAVLFWWGAASLVHLIVRRVGS